MKKVFVTVMAAAIVLLYPSARAADDEAWTLKKNNGGIEIFVRKVPGSKMREFRALMRIPGASLSSLVAVFDDAASYPRWMHNCIEARVVKRISSAERITYSATKAPWPVSDRDMITRSIIRQDPSTLAITLSIRALPEYLPAVEGRVRVQKLDATWTFRPEADGSVLVIYQLHSEPGGSLPVGLANLAVVEMPYNTFLKLRNIVREEKYATARFPQISEPAR